MMYRVRRVQIGNSGEIAWESKRAEIIPWPMELTVGGLYALRSGRLSDFARDLSQRGRRQVH